jgi:hypothetical protein
MAKKIVFILTEGDHDSAFIYRILKANGLTKYHIAIKDYPTPLKELMTNGISSIPLEELNMEEARSRFLPSYIMKKEEDCIVSIYRVGGIAKNEVRKDFIKKINDLNISDPEAIQAIDSEIKISILFFFDADNDGIDNRISQIKNELKQIFTSAANIDELNHKEILLVEDINFGGFIFTKTGTGKGMLEDILLTLMKQSNEAIFYMADYFLGIHEGTNLFRGKVEYDGTTKEKTKIKKVNKERYSYTKSLVGTVGQLQVSGSSNTVCISKADYFTDEKIKSDATCVDIYNFIQKALI